MQTLKLSDAKALQLYPSATAEWKQILEESFGKEFFNQKITDRVKTYEDACQILGIDPDLGLSCAKSGVWKDIENITAYSKLMVIARALNQDLKADWADSNQRKWYPWFEYSASGFRFYGTVCDRTLRTRLLGFAMLLLNSLHMRANNLLNYTINF